MRAQGECPRCEISHACIIKWREGPYAILECQECTLCFLRSPLDAQQNVALYNEKFYSEDPFFAETLELKLMPLIKDICPPPAKVLDYGCGQGSFMTTAILHGYDVEGIDFSPVAIELCKNKGLSVTHLKDESSIGIAPRTYDCITMWDVIEHLRIPKPVMRNIYSLLKPDGILIVKTPHIEWLRYLLGRLITPFRSAVPVFMIPAHVLFFTENTLVKFLEETGFNVDKVVRLKRLRAPAKSRTFRGRTFILLTRALSSVGMFGNVLVFARKKSGFIK